MPDLGLWGCAQLRLWGVRRAYMRAHLTWLTADHSTARRLIVWQIPAQRYINKNKCSSIVHLSYKVVLQLCKIAIPLNGFTMRRKRQKKTVT